MDDDDLSLDVIYPCGDWRAHGPHWHWVTGYRYDGFEPGPTGGLVTKVEPVPVLAECPGVR